MRTRDPKKLFLRYRRRGDAAALGRVFDLVAPELLAIAIHVTRDVATAEDAVQETFLIAVEGADRYDATRPFVPWLVGILVHRAKKGRERSADPRLGSRGGDGTPLDELRTHASEADPVRTVAAREVEGLVGRAVDGLQEPYRTVVHKHLAECAPPRDIAVALGRAPGTVRVQLHRGLEQLRTALGGRDGSGAAGRLSGFGLALPAAFQLGTAPAAGLSAMREAVVHAATTHAASAEVVHRTSIVPASIALATCAATLAVLAAQLGDRSSDRGLAVEPQPLAAVSALPEDEAELAPVSDRRRSEPRATVDAPRRTRRGFDGAGASRGARTSKTSQTPLPPAVAPVDPVPFYLEPRLDLHRVHDLEPAKRTTLAVRDAAGSVIGSDHGHLFSLTRLKVGQYGTPDEVPLLYAYLDHPDALPQMAPIPISAWSRSGEGYVATVKIELRPIQTTVTVTADSSTPFRGRVQLRSFGETGSRLLDEKNASDPARLGVTLRVPDGEPAYAVLGLPKEQHLNASMILLEAPRDGDHTLESKLERVETQTLEFEVVDPFRDPLQGVLVRALVPEEWIALRTEGTGAAVEIEGWIIATGDGVPDTFHAQLEGGRRYLRELGVKGSRKDARIPLVVARRLVQETTGSGGKVSIRGAIPGLHTFQIRTEWNDGPVDSLEYVPGGMSGAAPSIRVLAPIAAVEVGPPAGLLSTAEGRAAWRRANVTITVGGRTVDGTYHPSGRFRALLPPYQPLQIRAELGAFGTSTAQHAPIPSGSAGLTTLRQPTESTARGHGDNGAKTEAVDADDKRR